MPSSRRSQRLWVSLLPILLLLLPPLRCDSVLVVPHKKNIVSHQGEATRRPRPATTRPERSSRSIAPEWPGSPSSRAEAPRRPPHLPLCIGAVEATVTRDSSTSSQLGSTWVGCKGDAEAAWATQRCIGLKEATVTWARRRPRRRAAKM